MISIGITARSCTTSSPTMARLASVEVTPAAESVLSTTMVLERETIAPSQMESVTGSPRNLIPASAPPAAVRMI